MTTDAIPDPQACMPPLPPLEGLHNAVGVLAVAALLVAACCIGTAILWGRSTATLRFAIPVGIGAGGLAFILGCLWVLTGMHCG